MDVKAPRAGLLYLRGTSYGRYDGRYWTMTGEYADGESLFTLGGSLSGAPERVEVRRASESLLYTPYAVVKGGVSARVRENYIAADGVDMDPAQTPGIIAEACERAAQAAKEL